MYTNVYSFMRLSSLIWSRLIQYIHEILISIRVRIVNSHYYLMSDEIVLHDVNFQDS